MLETLDDARTADLALVQSARSGDDTARGELYERHRGDSFRLAYRLLGNEHDALDVVQDSMIKAFAGLDDFDGRCGFRTWLLRIVTNTALDWGRRRKRQTKLFEADSAGKSDDLAALDDPSARLQQQDLRRILDQALDRLSPALRTTFVLHAELQLSYKEIAETQDVPIGTVMSRIHAARGKLQAVLDWNRLKDM